MKEDKIFIGTLVAIVVVFFSMGVYVDIKYSAETVESQKCKAPFLGK